MKPNGKKNERSIEEIKQESQAIQEWYEVFVASVETIMKDRRTGGHPVNAGYQMGYFLLFTNIFQEMNVISEEERKKILKHYTDECSKYIDRSNVAEIMKHFQDLYMMIVEDGSDAGKTVNNQKKFIMAMEMDLNGPETDVNDVADCLNIASHDIAEIMKQLSNE